jgi:hypothetical protein
VILGLTEIRRRLGFHPGTPTTAPLYEKNRAEIIHVADAWDRRLPPGRETALAFTALQEALMWANAAIACAQPLGAERTDGAERSNVVPLLPDSLRAVA